MVNFVVAVVIGAVLGAIGAVILRRLQPTAALWLAPALGVGGALVAAVLGAVLGHAGYGWKKALLQVVLAAAGVGVAAFLAKRETAGQPASSSTASN